MELHPAIAFGGVIVGATLLGPAGAFLALPIIATGQAFFSSMMTTHDLVESEMFEDVPAPAPEGDADDSADREGDAEDSVDREVEDEMHGATPSDAKVDKAKSEAEGED
jgi:hypothetical protein